MSSHTMNRSAPISVFSDQRRTKSTIWSRVSCGTQTPVRVPQAFFLARHAQTSIRPELVLRLDLLLKVVDSFLLGGMVGPRFRLKGSRSILEELFLPTV